MAENMKKISEAELSEISGGVDGMVGLFDDGEYKTVAGIQKNYLALRTEPCYKYENEIGKLYNGDRVKICGNGAVADHDFGGQQTGYVWVYAPTLNKSGWVNSSFLR